MKNKKEITAWSFTVKKVRNANSIELYIQTKNDGILFKLVNYINGKHFRKGELHEKKVEDDTKSISIKFENTGDLEEYSRIFEEFCNQQKIEFDVV